MDQVTICQNMRLSTYQVKVSDKDGEYSTGSGVAINPNGILVTAAHVITNRLPVREEDVLDPSIKILAKENFGNEWVKYKTNICGITIFMELLKKPITIDISVLLPSKKITNSSFLNVNCNEVIVGEDVFMAGYSDEMQEPLSIINIIDTLHPAIKNSRGKITNEINELSKLMIVKKGMIGQSSNITFYGTENKEEYSGQIFCIDNGMHSGASGGPVVNKAGELIGIIAKRAITDSSTADHTDLKVPSGTTIAVGIKFISRLIERDGLTKKLW